ncbi:transmembrane and immunoglobulin domain-containing protein 2 [Passer domesticus]|uniref:transmembrane and immunoglobulin domain-containing protein 2 n=1 Tax=Passer domesticus TaxID=48849 RepID=UPI0030FF2985
MWQLGVLIPLLGAGALRVTQEPGDLQAAAGDTVALACQVEVAEGGTLLRMEWVRGGGLGVLCATRLSLGTPPSPFPRPRCARGAQLAWQPPRATLSLPQVRDSDSGSYVCRVTLEIPRHATATGNGTELRVSPAALGGHQAALLCPLLGGLGGTALLLAMAVLGHRCCRRSPGAAHPDTAIYVNVVSPPAAAKPPPPPAEGVPVPGGAAVGTGPPPIPPALRVPAVPRTLPSSALPQETPQQRCLAASCVSPGSASSVSPPLRHPVLPPRPPRVGSSVSPCPRGGSGPGTLRGSHSVVPWALARCHPAPEGCAGGGKQGPPPVGGSATSPSPRG